MTGFESVGKAAEEASPDFRSRGFFRAIWMAIFIGILFYASIVAAVVFVAPWRQLTGEKFMTAVAFRQALGSQWIVQIILAAALLSLFKCFNGNFVAASRLLFALGRRGMVNPRVGTIQRPLSDAVNRGALHRPRNRYLHAAGRRDSRSHHRSRFGGVRDRLVRHLRSLPGSGTRSTQWDDCVGRRQSVAWFALACLAIAMALMKMVPMVPGHFRVYEWLALGIWIALGASATASRKLSPN